MDHEHINKQMAVIKATLEGAGYAVTSLIHDMETADPPYEQETLRVEYAMGKTKAVYHLVSAEAFLGDAKDYQRRISHELRMYIGNCVATEPRNCQAYLLVVGDDSYVSDPAREAVISALELDDSMVRKYVCGVSEVLDWVKNPFETWQTPASERTPRLYVLPDVPDPWGPALPEVPVNREFTVPTAEELCSVLATHPRAEQIKAVTEQLLRRSMGTAHRLRWLENDYPEILRSGRAMPLEFYSRNEQRLFFVAFFLARAHADEQAGLFLGLTGIMEGWDLVRRFAVTDALRDFVLATGASMRLVVTNRSLRPFFDLRLRPVLFGYVPYNQA